MLEMLQLAVTATEERFLRGQQASRMRRVGCMLKLSRLAPRKRERESLFVKGSKASDILT